MSKVKIGNLSGKKKVSKKDMKKVKGGMTKADLSNPLLKFTGIKLTDIKWDGQTSFRKHT